MVDLPEPPSPGDEAAFVDSVSWDLRLGRFVLLVVGDGIREEVEAMASFLAATPQLQFTLALVELQLWQLDDRLMVVPFVVTRTREMTRAIVEVAGDGAEHVTVLPVETQAPQKGRPTFNEASFIDAVVEATGDAGMADYVRVLLDDLAATPGVSLEMRRTGVFARTDEPRVTFVQLLPSGVLHTWKLADSLERAGCSRQLGEEFVQRVAELMGSSVDDAGSWSPQPPLAAVRSRHGDLLGAIGSLVRELSPSD